MLLAALLAFVPLHLAYSGELDRRTIGRSVEWTPDSCYKPSLPTFYAYDTFSYNMAVDAFNTYVIAAKTYLSCATREASADLSTFRNVLDDSLGRETSEMQSRIESAKSELSLSRSMIRR
jgi:hypothetical protein